MGYSGQRWETSLDVSDIVVRLPWSKSSNCCWMGDEGCASYTACHGPHPSLRSHANLMDGNGGYLLAQRHCVPSCWPSLLQDAAPRNRRDRSGMGHSAQARLGGFVGT